MKRVSLGMVLLVAVAGSAAAQFAETNVTILRRIPGPSALANFGAWINNVGDTDKDGVADLIVGAPEVGGAGAAYLYSGRTGTLLFTFTPDLNGGHFGASVSAAGDINGDGTPDIAVGAPDVRTKTGAVYLYSGSDGALIRRLDGAATGDELGFAPGPIPDTNGDGRPDVLVGAPGANAATGAVYVFSGRDGAIIRTIHGRNPKERFGSAVNALRDISGDGKSEILAGALDRPPNDRGGGDVISGAGDQVLFEIPSDAFSRALGWAYISDAGDVNADGKADILAGDFAHDGTTLNQFAGRAWVYSGADFRLLHSWTGTPQSGLGECRAAGDVNGDGYGDLLIAAYNDETLAQAAGSFAVYSGRDGSVLMRLTCNVRGDQFGVDVAPMGDVNNDGFADFAVSAPGADVNGRPNQGMVYLVSGAGIPQVTVAGTPQDLLVSSRFSNNILRYDGATGAFRGVFASGNGLANPNGIAYGRDGRLYAGLGDQGRVLRFDGQTGRFIDAFVKDDPATTTDESGGLAGARAIAFGPEGDLYVDDGPRNRVLRYDGTTGRFIGVATGESDLRGPVGLSFGPDGTMFVGGGLSDAAYAFRDGVLVKRYACPGQTAITGVLPGADGRLYAADPGTHTIYRFDVASGECLGAFATGGGLNIPIGLAWAPDGNLLAGSFNTNSVIKYDRVTGAVIGTFVQPGAGGLSGTHNFAFVPAPVPVPTLAITRPTAGATIAPHGEIVVRVTDFALDCAAPGTANAAGHGHLRLDVDGRFDSDSCKTSTTLAGTYAAGAHVVTVSLVNNDGTVLAPPLSASVSIRIAPDVAYISRLAVPGVGKLQGVGGSFFRTTLWMTNAEAEAMLVRLRYVATGAFPDGSTEKTAFAELPGRHMIRYGDVLTDAFGLTADSAGVVLIETEATVGPLPIVAARTFNDTAGGTFGQYIPAVPVGDGASASRLHGLAGDASARTNIGVLNVSASPLTAILSLWDPSGTQRGSDVSVTVPPWSSSQVNSFNRVAGLEDVSSFSVRMSTPAPAGFLYASKLDNKTSDPIFMSRVPPRSRQWIDGVGAVQGEGGASFRSFLSLANENDTPAHVSIAYTPRGATEAIRIVDVDLPAGQSTSYRDVMNELFAMTGTAGTLLVSTATTTPVSAWARTYSDRGESGTLGQFIPSFGAENLIGARGGLLQGISEDDTVRCNAGLVNTGTSAADAVITAYSSDGQQIASKTYHLEGGQTVFIGHILLDLGAGPRTDTYLIVTSPVPGVLYAWASFVDSKSTDPTFVRPFILR